VAISQRKVYELLALTRRFIAAYEGQLHELEYALAALDSGEMTKEQFVLLCRDLTILPQATLGGLQLELEREEIHYQLTHKKNEAERLRKRAKRRDPEPQDNNDDLEADDIANALRGLDQEEQ
jgi:hypothetical protein